MSFSPKVKQIWVRKDRPKCNVVCTALRARAPSEWYSGCSRHMTGEKFFFTSFEDFNGRNVTFSDGCITRVRGRYSVFISRYPDLDGVLFINGLKANLISIRQICDSEFSVKLS